jgi:hypothetical protein
MRPVGRGLATPALKSHLKHPLWNNLSKNISFKKRYEKEHIRMRKSFFRHSRKYLRKFIFGYNFLLGWKKMEKMNMDKRKLNDYEQSPSLIPNFIPIYFIDRKNYK